MQLPMMAALLAGIVLAAGGGGDAGIGVIAGTQAAAIREQRRFSRQNEQEADRIGILNRKSRLRPRNMPSMFERLARQYRYDAKPRNSCSPTRSPNRVSPTPATALNKRPKAGSRTARATS